MAQPITWVGIDDDKMNLTVAVSTGSEEPRVQRIPNEDGALRRWVRRLVRATGGGEIRMCYEAGPNGFALMRRLEAMGPVTVEVMAPTLTPRRSGRKVKTDPLDAQQLVGLYRSGELTPVAIPDATAESARDLVRTYHRVGEELLRKRNHVLKFLVRRGRIYRAGTHWTGLHRRWLRSQHFEAWTDTTSFEELLTGLRELEDRRQRLRQALDRLSQEESCAMEVTALRCFHGIDTGMALTLVTEIFDVRRFRHPRDLMSYFGQTPSVHQSGTKDVRGSITKAGNRYARWALGEIAHQFRHRPNVGTKLRQRRQGQPPWVLEIADRAHQRLHRRHWALVLRGMPVAKASTAVARELTAFVWEALTEVRRRGRPQTA